MENFPKESLEEHLETTLEEFLKESMEDLKKKNLARIFDWPRDIFNDFFEDSLRDSFEGIAEKVFVIKIPEEPLEGFLKKSIEEGFFKESLEKFLDNF